MLKLSHTVIARQRLTKFTANAAPAASPQAGPSQETAPASWAGTGTALE